MAVLADTPNVLTAENQRSDIHWQSPIAVALKGCRTLLSSNGKNERSIEDLMNSSDEFRRQQHMAHSDRQLHMQRHARILINMGLLRNVILFVTLITILTFVALFGQLPAFRKTPVGWLYRLLCLHAPRALRHVDRQLFDGRLDQRSRRLGRYLFHEQNPVVLIIFLSVVTGSAGLFLWNASHLLPASLVYPIPIILGMPYYFTYACVTCKAHYVTASNHTARMHDYPFDNVLYKPNNICSTCQREKPPRSKHCSLCGFCVAKCDHHCPWVNNCLGRHNYRHFLALLLSLSLLEVYGAYLCFYILWPDITSTPPQTSLWSALSVKFVVGVRKGGMSVAGVGLLASWTAALPLGLFCYHVYLIWAGMTTNESQKWSDWREDMACGLVFKTTRTALVEHNRQRAQAGPSNTLNGQATNLLLQIGLNDDHSQKTPWPIDSDQVLVQTSNGKAPYGQEMLWTQVWDLADVDNIYDLGMWDNLRDVLRGR